MWDTVVLLYFRCVAQLVLNLVQPVRLDGTEWRRTLTIGFLPQCEIIEGESSAIWQTLLQGCCCCHCYDLVVMCSFCREAASKALNATGQDNINMETLYQASGDWQTNISFTCTRNMCQSVMCRPGPIVHCTETIGGFVTALLSPSRFCRCSQCAMGKQKVFCSLCLHFWVKESHDSSRIRQQWADQFLFPLPFLSNNVSNALCGSILLHWACSMPCFSKKKEKRKHCL